MIDDTMVPVLTYEYAQCDQLTICMFRVKINSQLCNINGIPILWEYNIKMKTYFQNSTTFGSNQLFFAFDICKNIRLLRKPNFCYINRIYLFIELLFFIHINVKCLCK